MMDMDLSGKKIALIGCGDIAGRMIEPLLQAGARVSGLRRNIETLPDVIDARSIDITNPQSLTVLAQQAFDYVVVTLSPDQLNDEAYQNIYVSGLKNILQALNTTALKKLLWISSTSVYGQNDGGWVDESAATEPSRFSGKRQLEAEELIKSLGDKAVIIRFAGIYRDNRFRLLERIQQGLIGSVVENDYFTNRIHVDDCAGFLLHLIKLDVSGRHLHRVYLAADSWPVLYSELIRDLAQQMNIQLPDKGQTQTPRVGNKRIANQRLLDSGYQLKYPGYKQGLAGLLAGINKL